MKRPASTLLTAITLVAVATLSASPALGAQFGPGSSGTISEVTATSAQEFVIEGMTLTCSEVKGTGDYTKAEAVFAPEYSGCSASSTSASVTNVNCDYLLSALAGGSPTYTSDMSIVKQPAPGGCYLDIFVSFLGFGCHVHIVEQEGLELVEAENLREAELELKAGLTGVSYTDEGAGCRLAGIASSSGSNGEYTGDMEVAGLEIL